MTKAEKKSIPAVVLKSLGSIAPTFDMPVDIPVRGADPIKVTLTCKALGKLAWAKARDAANEAAYDRNAARAKAIEEAEDRPRLKIAEIVEEGMNSDAELVLQFATGWDLDDDLTADNLARLEDQCGGALRAIVEAYELAVYQSRLGNSETRPAR